MAPIDLRRWRRRRRQAGKVLRRRRRSLASPPSASSTSTPTASSSPNRSGLHAARPSQGRYASLDAFLTRLERRRAEAGHHRGAGSQGRLPRRTRRAGRPRLRRLRSRLPRRLRPAAAHPQGAGREGEKAQCLRPSTATRPAPSSTRCSKNTPTAASTASSRSKFSRSTRFTASAPRRDRQALRRQAWLPRRRPASSKPHLYAGSCLTHAQRLQPRQNHPGHHAQGRRHLRRRAAPRAARLDVLPENLRRPREGDSNSCATTTSRRSRSTSAGRTWATDEEGITGDALLDFVNNTLLPEAQGAHRRRRQDRRRSSAWPSRTPTTT